MQEVPAAELLHETIVADGRCEARKRCSGRKCSTNRIISFKVEHEDTILSEEMKRNTEIDQPIEVEKQAPEESVIVKAEEKLEETIMWKYQKNQKKWK